MRADAAHRRYGPQLKQTNAAAAVNPCVVIKRHLPKSWTNATVSRRAMVDVAIVDDDEVFGLQFRLARSPLRSSLLCSADLLPYGCHQTVSAVDTTSADQRTQRCPEDM